MFPHVAVPFHSSYEDDSFPPTSLWVDNDFRRKKIRLKKRDIWLFCFARSWQYPVPVPWSHKTALREEVIFPVPYPGILLWAHGFITILVSVLFFCVLAWSPTRSDFLRICVCVCLIYAGQRQRDYSPIRASTSKSMQDNLHGKFVMTSKDQNVGLKGVGLRFGLLIVWFCILVIYGPIEKNNSLSSALAVRCLILWIFSWILQLTPKRISLWHSCNGWYSVLKGSLDLAQTRTFCRNLMLLSKETVRKPRGRNPKVINLKFCVQNYVQTVTKIGLCVDMHNKTWPGLQWLNCDLD